MHVEFKSLGLGLNSRNINVIFRWGLNNYALNQGLKHFYSKTVEKSPKLNKALYFLA